MSERPNDTKVLIAIPVLFVGGTEIHTLNLVKALASEGYHVSICCYYDYDSSIVLKFKETGAEIILMGLRRSEGLLTLFIKLVGLFKKVRPTIVHVQYIAPGLIPIVAAKLAGVKKVLTTVHQPGRTHGLKAKFFVRTAAYLCDAFFCNSKSVEESWFGDSEIFNPAKKNRKRKHFTIYNGIDAGRIEKIVNKANKETIEKSLNIKGKKVIGVVGRLREEKGQFRLLQSMKEVIKSVPNSVLLVVGDGPDRSFLEKTAVELGINDHIVWLGKKNPDEVFSLYSIMDFVVVPSVFEGFSLTAAEAMAAHRPVVGSDVDGLPEVIIDNVTGYLVPVKDCVIMTRRLVELLSNKQKAVIMGQAGYQRVVENFGVERFAASVSAVYHFYSD